MRCDVLAVGTELLLGQIVDTNSSWIGEQLAAAGIDSYLHIQVGDNQARMVGLLRYLLEQADAVIVCGGLGPTQDDITREAIAEVMGTSLERREDLIDVIRQIHPAFVAFVEAAEDVLQRTAHQEVLLQESERAACSGRILIDRRRVVADPGLAAGEQAGNGQGGKQPGNHGRISLRSHP